MDETGGVGVVAANKKMAADPRYSMSMTTDIKPGETQKQAKKFGNSVDKMGIPPKLKTNGKISEDISEHTIFDIHYEFLKKISKLDSNLFENGPAYSELQSFLADYQTPDPELGAKYIYTIILSTPMGRFMNIAYFKSPHKLVDIRQDKLVFNIAGKLQAFPENASVSGDGMHKVFLFKNQQQLNEMISTLGLKFSDWKIDFKNLTEGKSIEEATMSATIQARNPVSAGARGLVGARWKFRNNVQHAENMNMDNAVAALAAKLPDIEQVNYESVDQAIHEVCHRFQIDPKELHNAFIAKYKLTSERFSIKVKHERKNRPKSI